MRWACHLAWSTTRKRKQHSIYAQGVHMRDAHHDE